MERKRKETRKRIMKGREGEIGQKKKQEIRKKMKKGREEVEEKRNRK